jgi:pimeloyl-ACP methyl ester carboxylesterase
MKILRTLALAAIVAAPFQGAFAREEVIDYQGNKIVLEEAVVNNKGVKINTYSVGKGPVLIISHGNGDGWFGWAHQLHMLSQKYKVVLYDLRNFNKSDKTLGVPNGANANFESDLLAVQNHYTKGPAIHMGNDQGGMVLWMYAMNYPEKVRLMIQTNTIHPRAFIRELAKNTEQAKASWYIEHMIVNGKGPNMMRPGTTPMATRPGDTESMTKLRQEAAKRTGDEGRQGTVDWYRANFPGKPYTPGSRAFGSHGQEFPHVKAPTLVVVDLNDFALHPGGYDDLGMWIDADFTMVTWHNGSHFQQSQYPERFNKLIGNWLAFNDTETSR